MQPEQRHDNVRPNLPVCECDEPVDQFFLTYRGRRGEHQPARITGGGFIQKQFTVRPLPHAT